MADAPAAPFTPEVSAAVADHMNTDHPEDNLLIVRSLGGVPDATDASMAGISADGAHFDAVVEDVTVPTVVPWAVPVTERATIRLEVVRMYQEACAALGVTPRRPGEH